MVILVTANNYLLMFVGWEGSLLKCLIWPSHSYYSELNFSFLIINRVQKRFFYSRKLKSIDRIGPHNLNIISLIVGSLLSSSYLEKRSHESEAGVRIIFIKYGNNVEYIMWFYSTLAKAGYCSYKKPKLYKLIAKGNKVLFFYVLKSFSFSSFTWLYSLFYRNNLKIIPQNLYEYITPLALATLFLSSTWAGEKAIFKAQSRLNTSLSASHGLNNLSEVLKNKYNIETENKNSDLSSESLYIKDSSRAAFTKVVKKHILPSQLHLLSKPNLKLTLFGNPPFKRGMATLPDLDKSRDCKRKLRKEYELSLEQKQALIGIMLGDGYLHRPKPTNNTALYIEQSYPEKEEYVKFLYRLMEPVVLNSPSVVTRKPDRRTGKISQSLRFWTMAMPCLNYYHDLFYKDKVKSVPRNLGELLTARGLAYFIMDDGGKSVYNQTILHTRAFKLEDVEYIQSVLLENFGITTRLEEKKKDQWVIFIPVRQKTRLKDIVGPYMHESMLYKI